MPLWCIHEIMHIDEALKPSLDEQGLSCYKRFIEYKEGLCVSKKHKRDVRTVDLLIGGKRQKYFLKQYRIEPFRRVWRCIRKGQCPHSIVFREMQVLKFFEEQKIPVMRAVGWGEKRLFGWPASGFLLLEEVKGKEFVDLFNTSNHLLRKQMMRVYGALVGHIHQKGINSKIRPRDIICVSDNFSDYSKSLVIIDRERGKPFTVDMPIEKCAAQLADIFIVSIPNIGAVERYEIAAFLVGYFSENHSFYKYRDKFVQLIAAEITSQLEQKDRYEDVRKIPGK